MPKDDNIRLRHMLDAAREAIAFSIAIRLTVEGLT